MTEVAPPSQASGLEPSAVDGDVAGIAGADVAQPPSPPDSAPVLITEQEVLLATTATAQLRRRTSLRGAVGRVVEMTRSWRQARADSRPIRHDRPSRSAYLERSGMAREMWRL